MRQGDPYPFGRGGSRLRLDRSDAFGRLGDGHAAEHHPDEIGLQCRPETLTRDKRLFDRALRGDHRVVLTAPHIRDPAHRLPGLRQAFVVLEDLEPIYRGERLRFRLGGPAVWRRHHPHVAARDAGSQLQALVSGCAGEGDPPVQRLLGAS